MSAPRIGDWMQTATGRKFWPLDPRPEDVCIEDIAHALANVCRFGGHCRTFYSVAEHSVRVSLASEEKARTLDLCTNDVRLFALAGLLHDAAETYIGDMVRPLKKHPSMTPFCFAEEAIEAAVSSALRCPLNGFRSRTVKWADETLLATEVRDIMGGESAGKWALREKPLDDVIVDPWYPGEARRAFLGRFHALSIVP